MNISWKNKLNQDLVMVSSTPCLILTKKNNKLISDECYFFHCPHCEDLKADDQLLMGDHVIINHVKEHISRNAKPLETHECSLCHKNGASLNFLQDHVRSEHPDVVVI